MKNISKILRNPHLWIITVLIIFIGIVNYPEQIIAWESPSILSFWGLSEFTIERTLLLIPIVYASFIFGLKGNTIVLIVAGIIMLPRTIFFPSIAAEAWLETIGIILMGTAAGFILNYYHRSTAQMKSIQKMLSTMIDGSPIATFAIDKNHKVTHWNRALEVLSGIKREEVLGTDQQWRAFYNSKRPVMADLIISGASLDDVNQQYQGKRGKSGLIEGAYESEDLLPAAKEDRWLHFTASPIRDSNGNITGAIETLEDITERKKAEQALITSERRFRDLFENALDPIWVQDPDGYITLANQAAAKITGLSLDELTKRNVKDFLTPESLQLARDVRYRLLREQKVESPYEAKIINTNGSEAIFMIRSNLLLDEDGKPSGIQNIARDVTEEKRMTENLRYYLHQITRAQEDERKRVARELHDSTAQNLIALLHELENLLQISGMPENGIKEIKGLYEKTKEMLQEIRRFSRDLRPAILDDLGLLPALDWVTDQIKNEYKIDVSLKVNNTSGRRLSSEAELHLFRIVQEGLRNIGKHARATKAEVSVVFNDNNVKLTVSDNGAGFQLPRNIDELSQNNKLGLLGMQERVQLLAGTLKITSEPDKGTVINVEAPV